MIKTTIDGGEVLIMGILMIIWIVVSSWLVECSGGGMVVVISFRLVRRGEKERNAGNGRMEFEDFRWRRQKREMVYDWDCKMGGEKIRVLYGEGEF